MNWRQVFLFITSKDLLKNKVTSNEKAKKDPSKVE